MAEKKKKEKITYVDDGRSLADMSGVDAGMGKYFSSTPSYSSFRDKWNTYWAAFRMMLIPTLVASLCLALMFGVMYLLFRFVAQ